MCRFCSLGARRAGHWLLRGLLLTLSWRSTALTIEMIPTSSFTFCLFQLSACELRYYLYMLSLILVPVSFYSITSDSQTRQARSLHPERPSSSQRD